MCSYAEELIVYFKNDNFNKDDLLEPLKTLLINIKTYKSEATSLKKQVERVGNSLGEIAKEISEYNEKINDIKNNNPNRIKNANELAI